MTPKPKTLACPTCKGAVPAREKNQWFPFCSDRCKAIDLGRWFTGSYAVPGRPADPQEQMDSDDEDAPKRPLH